MTDVLMWLIVGCVMVALAGLPEAMINLNTLNEAYSVGEETY